MRSPMIIVVAALLVLASVGQAQKMVVDVDKAFDFTKFKTFGWSDGQVAPKATTGQMLTTAIENELISRGLVRSDAAPDLG